MPFLVLLVPAVVVLLWYIDRTFVDTVWEDGFIYVPLIGRFLEGHLAPGDLFIHFGEHLLFGQAVLNLLNAKFLALDMRLDAVVSLTAYAATAAIIYAECSRVFSNIRAYLLGILFVPLGLLCFSLVSPPTLLMSTQFACGSAVALLIAWFLQQGFNTSTMDNPRPRWPLIGMLILIPLYFLVFSSAYFPGLVLGLGAMYLCRAIITRRWHIRHMVSLAAVIAACVMLYYWYVFQTTGLYSGQGSFLNRLSYYFSTGIFDTILSYIAGISSSVMDQHTIMERLPWEAGNVFLVLGGAMAIMGAVALWLFFKTGMYRKTYLPIYCMFYPLGIITSVRFGRGMIGGWGWMTNEWYSFQTKFFVIGAVWILLYALVEYMPRVRIEWASIVKLMKSWPIIFASVALAFIFACHAYANVAQWHRGPYVHIWLAEKRNALLFPEFYDNPANVILWPEASMIEGRAILEKHELSCFSPRGLADIFAGSPDGVLYISGWYTDNWVGRKGYAALMAQAEGGVSFEGFVPDFISSNYVEVRLNDEVIFTGNLAGGVKTSFSGHSRKGINLIAVTCEREVAPASIGVNPDLRPLAFWLSIQRQ